MRARLFGALLVLAVRLPAQNAPAALPCSVTDLVKDGTAYRIVTPGLVYVNCDATDLAQFDTAAKLYVVAGTDRKPVDNVQAIVKLYAAPWIRIDLRKTGGGPALVGGQDYQIELAPDQRATVAKLLKGRPAPMAGPFAPLAIGISTKPAATVGPSEIATLGAKFLINSNIALRPFDKKGPKFAEVGALKVLTYHDSESLPLGATVPECSAPAGCPEPQVASGNPVSFGRAQVVLASDRLHQPKVTVQVTGFHDIFGDELKIKNEVALGSAPKTKDDSMYYLKVNHQAGPGAKPGFVVEAKVAPQLGRPSVLGFLWQPALNMDIGSGSVDGVKLNDTIIPSLGLTRLYRRKERGLEAVRATSAVSFETNREFNKKNLTYDQEFQFFFSDLTLSRAARSWRLYPELKKKDESLAYAADLSDYGAGLQFFAGSELGHALLEQTVKASKSTATVTVPAYPVARIRPRVTAFAEYKRISLTFTAALRYLFATEYATRESADGKSVRLAPVSGFRPYGEAGITIGLDASGHIALSATYKLGSQPPTFLYANTVQTGLLFRY
ncbi:MAG: hypothetical protein ABSC23_07110 [Bryobacteraceae bacterium]|jgi:hypothetical protein